MNSEAAQGGVILLVIIIIFVVVCVLFSKLLVKGFRKIERSDRDRMIRRNINEQILDRETERQIAIELLRKSGQL